MSDKFVIWKNTRQGLRLPGELHDIIHQYVFYDYESKEKLNEIYLKFIFKMVPNEKQLKIELDSSDLLYSSLYIKALINILSNNRFTLQSINTFSLWSTKAPTKMVDDLNILLNTYGIESKELLYTVFQNNQIIQYISNASFDSINDLLETLYEHKMLYIINIALTNKNINYKFGEFVLSSIGEGTKLYNIYMDYYKKK